ncbi:ABC transporter permease [Fodinibius sp.]|uniref:ABC transporter permease n=1 Tax=Fodinibius sp. TaxID=1872440 RepID=UPI003564E6A5
MKTIDLKMIRDLWNMRGQVIAIAFVIIAGVSVYVTMSSVSDTLQGTLKTYYGEYGFADGFASVRRAPESLGDRLRRVEGVNQVETRVAASVNLEIPGFDEPATGQIVSVPEGDQPRLNRLFIREGRLVESGREGEVVLNEVFAEAHSLAPGDDLTAIINGHRRSLTVVGVALSPEFLFQVQPGSLFPDPRRYGVMWMGQRGLSAAYDMEGAFNDLSFTLAPGANIDNVTDRMDLLLDPYGGEGAYPREDQASHNLISEELNQLAAMAFLLPMIFLGVAAFLLNIVVSRLIALQREQIAILKAFGYSDWAVAMHYVKLVVIVALVGVVVGTGLGIWMGGAMAEMYLQYYKFPFLDYTLQWPVVLTAILLTVGASLGGALRSIRRALRLPPAEAMRPAPPPSYRMTLVERLGLQKLLDQPTRIILRNLERQWVKSALTVIGIASSCAILIMGLFWSDAFDYIIQVQYGIAQREDITVTFNEPTSASAVYEISSLPGVQHAEPFRSVPVRLKSGHRSYDTGIEGIPPEPYLRRIINTELQPIAIPREGIVLTQNLAGILKVRPGDKVTVEVKEGRRYEREVPVVSLAEQYLGLGAYMDLQSANRLAGGGSAISGAFLMIDERYEDELTQTLQDRPRVAGIVAQDRAIESFMETSAESMLAMTFILSLFAGVIALGVVYNSVRISLSERDRELASMRVLGFTRGEIAYILLGEMALLVLLSIPMGLGIGALLSRWAAQSLQTEMYRIPVILGSDTFALAAAIVLIAAIISALLMRRRLNKLDLTAVLKTRE